MIKFKNLLLVSLVLIPLACTKENIEKEQVKQVSSGQVIDRILDLGFAKGDIEEKDNYYLVEGDIVFQKNDTLSSCSTLKQARTTNIVTATTIYVYLNPNFTTISAKISSALNGAIAEYNSLQSKLTFVRTTNAASANITILNNNLGGNMCGQGGFPFASGAPYNYVLISETYLVSNSLTSYDQLLFLLAHEMGHNIGLRHTNWSQRGEGIAPGAIRITGTPTSDGFSIMNAATCGYAWWGFSEYDKVAILNIYPSNAYVGWHTFTPSCSTTGEGLGWYASFNSISLPNGGRVTQTYTMTGGSQYKVTYSVSESGTGSGASVTNSSGTRIPSGGTWANGNLNFSANGAPGHIVTLNGLKFERYY